MSTPFTKVDNVSTALYRRYRPDTFDQVIGQEHVTRPLKAALRAGKVTHAYLFSGPRGCGKTTSARIMARCLNCAQGPTDTPCGECESCKELATGGPGSLDVVEIDAASHNGVDDARDLRERATFAPVRDRYKIFILDEAHMVTLQGFNALLKLVEEPPEHVKFIFATTEPDKVISTIRSRTHHYPFRLVPPDIMEHFLEGICKSEGVNVAPGVLPLVVRAGAGSVRDSLSVLDQLVAGVDDGRLDYEESVALLGYTDNTLLDEAVDALAAKDAGAAFRVVDRMVESGHDPRRFVEDFLQRLRDLVIVALAGNDAPAALHAVPADQLERMRIQAQNWGAVELTFAASQTNEALSQMKGAVSPRLQVELLMARLLLGSGAQAVQVVGEGGPSVAVLPVGSGPRGAERTSADESDPEFDHLTNPAAIRAALAKKRQAKEAPADKAGQASGQPAAPTAEPVATQTEPAVTQAEPSPAKATDEGPGVSHAPHHEVAAEGPSAGHAPHHEATDSGPAADRLPHHNATDSTPVASEAVTADAATQSANAVTPAQNVSAGQAFDSSDSETIRRRWAEVIDNVKRHSRSTWARVKEAQAGDIRQGILSLVVENTGMLHALDDPSHLEIISHAVFEVTGVRVEVHPVTPGQTPVGQAAKAGGIPKEPVSEQQQPIRRDKPEVTEPSESQVAEPPAPAPAKPQGEGEQASNPSASNVEGASPQPTMTEPSEPQVTEPAKPQVAEASGPEPDPVEAEKQAEDDSAQWFKQWARDNQGSGATSDAADSTGRAGVADAMGQSHATGQTDAADAMERPGAIGRADAIGRLGAMEQAGAADVAHMPGTPSGLGASNGPAAPSGPATPDDTVVPFTDERPSNVTAFPGTHLPPENEPTQPAPQEIPDEEQIEQLIQDSDTVTDAQINQQSSTSAIELAQQILGGTIIKDDNKS